MKLGYKQFISAGANLIIYILCMIYLLMCWDKSVTYQSWAIEVSIVSVILLIYQIIMMIFVRCQYYSMILWFTLMNYIFIFGRIYLKALGYENELGWNLFARYSYRDAYHAALYCLCYIQGMFTGMILFRTSKIKRRTSSIIKENINIKRIGIILFVLTFLVKIYCDVVQIMTQRISGGYVAVVDINGVLGAIGQLFPISVIYLISSNELSERKCKLIYLLYCLYSIIMMILSGDRRYAMIGIIAVSLCYFRKNSIKINLRRILMFVLIAFCGLTILTAIRRIRETGMGSIETVMEAIKLSLSEDNIIYELFNEFGLTFYTYMLAFKDIPAIIPYRYGASYIFAFLSVIPGAYRFAYNVIMENNIYQSIYAIENQGLGGAFGQELYGNFGLFAPVFAIFAGYFLQKMMGHDDNNNENNLARYYSLFYLFLNLVRASFAEIIRVLIYYFVIVWLINYFIRSRKR